MSALRHIALLARIDVTRTVRNHTTWRGGSSSVVGALVYGLMITAASLGGGYLGYRVGQSLAADGMLLGSETGVVLEAMRGVVALFWLALTVVFVVRAVGQRGTLARPEGILTVVPTRQALGGVLLAEYVYFLLWFLLPAASIGTGLAVGATAIWPVLAVPAGVAAAGIGSVSIGYLVGLTIRHGASRLEFVARNKGAIIAIVFLGYFVALSMGAIDTLMVRLFEPMQLSPMAWYADLILFGTPEMAASALLAAGAIPLSLALAAVGIVAGTRVADRHWFSDPVLADDTPAADEDDGVHGIEPRIATALGRQTGALVTLSWRRARRSPLKLLYAFYPMLLLAAMVADIVQTGAVPAYLPFAVLVFAAWAAGVVFTLNPLGDQGAVLPSTLLSGVDGRTFVRAHLLAGLVVAVPLGTLVTAVVAVLSPVDRTVVLVLVAGTPVTMVLSAAASIGIGVAFPRFEATSVTRSMKTVLPSRWAFLLFTLYLFGTTGAAAIVYEPLVGELVAGIVSWVLPFGLGITPGTLSVLAWVALVAFVLVPVLSYRYAVRRFETYTLA